METANLGHRLKFFGMDSGAFYYDKNGDKTMNKQIDYNGLPYWIMEYCARMQKSGKLPCALFTDDFQYGEWGKILPEEWIDEAIKAGDINKALEKYFDVMGDLEHLFSCLCYFHIDVSKTLPEQILYLRIRTGDVIEMHYIVGQGSEFLITLAENSENLPLVIDWDEAVKLSKLTTLDQARWYFNDMYSRADKNQKAFLEENKDKIFFFLGVSVIRYGFVQRINLNNLYESLKGENIL